MTQQLSATLTPLDAALGGLLDRVRAVVPTKLPLTEAIGCVAAEMPKLAAALPPSTVAMVDGWAMRSHDLTGASSYAPAPLSTKPLWVEAGERLPDDCDCVIDDSSAEQSGPLFQVVTEAIPGEGVRRAGADFVAGATVLVGGRPIAAADLIAARAVGCDALSVRRPRVHVVTVPANDGLNHTAELIVALAREAGAQATLAVAVARDVTSIATAIGNDARDLLLLVGGSGAGHSDAAVEALARRGTLATHGIALHPGRTAATGFAGAAPAVIVPGTPASALAVWLALGRPLLDRLALRAPRQAIVRPLARKITSAIGFAELVLVKAIDGQWMPLAAGDLPLGQIAAADAWLIVPGPSEGYAEGVPVGALPLRDVA
jgi:molybdopterin biosynthesis enzyme